MRIKWTRRALLQFSDAENYIAEDNPQAARAVAQCIADATVLLRDNPMLGRSGRVVGTREWPVKRTPYLIAYTVKDNELIILRVIHSKRRWPQQID